MGGESMSAAVAAKTIIAEALAKGARRARSGLPQGVRDTTVRLLVARTYQIAAICAARSR